LENFATEPYRVSVYILRQSTELWSILTI